MAFIKKMNYVKDSYVFKGAEIAMTWIKTDRMNEDWKPVSQVYGICFNDKDEILIARETTNDKWQLLGGKPEKMSR